MPDATFFAAFPEYRSTVDIYAPASLTGGTAGTPSQVGTSVPCIIVPSSEQGRWGAAPEGLGGARSDFWFFDVTGTAAVLPGYEVKKGTVTYIVNGTADWYLAKVAGLALPH